MSAIPIILCAGDSARRRADILPVPSIRSALTALLYVSRP